MYYHRVRLEVLQLVLYMDFGFVMELAIVKVMCAAHYQPSPSHRAVELMKYGLVKLCTIWTTLNTGSCSGIRTFLKINQEKHSKPAVTKLVGSKNTQHFPPKLPPRTVEPTASKGTTLSGPDKVLDLPHSVRVQ